MILAFIAGLLASYWVETLVLRILIRVTKGEMLGTVKSYMVSRGVESKRKGSVVKVAAHEAEEGFLKGDSFNEVLDKYGSDVQKE